MVTKIENIPKEIQSLKQWVCWVGADKIPKNPNNGYNHSIGGENSAFGCRWHMSEEAKQKLREFNKGNSRGIGNKSRTGLSSWNKGLHTPYRGGGLKKGQILKKTKWLTPDGNIVEMGKGQVHRFHPDWREINN